MKKFLFLLATLFLLSCSDEKGREPAESACAAFLRNHESISEKIPGISCLNDTTLYYMNDCAKGYVFYAKFDNDSMWATKVGNFGADDFTFKNVAEWLKEKQSYFFSYTKEEKDKMKVDKIVSFKDFKMLVMWLKNISEEEFNKEFDEGESLAKIYGSLRDNKWTRRHDAAARKSDSSFYVKNGFHPEVLYIADAKGGYTKKILSMVMVDCCGNPRLSSPALVESTDSSFFIKYQDGNWLRYDEHKDSVSFFTKDTLDRVWGQLFRNDGDTANFVQQKLQYNCPWEIYECVD